MVANQALKDLRQQALMVEPEEASEIKTDADGAVSISVEEKSDSPVFKPERVSRCQY